jgi:hypothetical protein
MQPSLFLTKKRSFVNGDKVLALRACKICDSEGLQKKLLFAKIMDNILGFIPVCRAGWLWRLPGNEF